ncbi:helix-turn-helix domain-containing protein [Rhodococcus aetherivorans]|uniref:helix-turn-helix domain-containing protein n=1 Tax=Rhodococcus aetherivorans TaxID=191292 RepID=UPI001260FA4D
MTKLSVLPRDDQRETRRQAIARRLRGKLGERRMSQTRLSELSGINSSGLSRRLNGLMPFDIDELEVICYILEVDLDEILTGIANPRHPGGDGGSSVVRMLPRLDSNQQPFD